MFLSPNRTTLEKAEDRYLWEAGEAKERWARLTEAQKLDKELREEIWDAAIRAAKIADALREQEKGVSRGIHGRAMSCQ